jgi:hypothetical protein
MNADFRGSGKEKTYRDTEKNLPLIGPDDTDQERSRDRVSARELVIGKPQNLTAKDPKNRGTAHSWHVYGLLDAIAEYSR